MLPNVDSTEQLIVFRQSWALLSLRKLFYTLLPPSVPYANFTLWVRSITIEQIAAEFPGLHG